MFQLTAARRRLEVRMLCCGRLIWFQLTAARRRLAALATATMQESMVSTHSRPKAAGCIEATSSPPTKSFNSQPPEGGWAFCMSIESGAMRVSTHSRPKAAGQASAKLTELKKVSTHSRPKAAGCGIAPISAGIPRFNSQPPEGGWRICQGIGAETGSFNSQPPEGGWNNSF